MCGYRVTLLAAQLDGIAISGSCFDAHVLFIVCLSYQRGGSCRMCGREVGKERMCVCATCMRLHCMCLSPRAFPESWLVGALQIL